MPSVCPGPCNNAWRRAETARETHGTENHIRVVWGDPAQCWGCVDRTRQELLTLPALLVDVRDEALEGTPAKLTGTIGRISAATWPGQAARILIDNIVGEMATLEADILKLRGMRGDDYEPGPGTTPNEDERIAGLAATLSKHWDWAMQNHPAADEPYDLGNANPGGQVTGWYRQAQRFTKQDEQRDVERLAPCPRCQGPYLVESRDLRLVGDRPYIECRDPDCQRVMTGAEYDAYVKGLTGQIIVAA